MTECEKFVSFANPEFEDDNANSFEETIPKVTICYKNSWKVERKMISIKVKQIHYKSK